MNVGNNTKSRCTVRGATGLRCCSIETISTERETLVLSVFLVDLFASLPRVSSPEGLCMAFPEIRLFETAVVLAEELHFSRAAERLHIDQSTVSTRLNDLEDKVGYSLFQRSHKTVDLTEAGRRFVEEARVTLLHAERAVQVGRAASQDAEVLLNVGRSPYTDPFLVTTLLSVKLPLFPQMKIELSQQFSCDLIREVLAGGLDLAIATEPPDGRRLTMVKVAEAPFYIAMSKADKLASKPSVTLDMLTGRPWVIFERAMHPPVYDSVMQLARERNVAATKVHHIVVPEDSYPFIADSDAVAFVVKSGAIRIARDGITVRPLVEDSLVLRTFLASRADEKSKVVSELVRAFVRKVETFTKVRPLPVATSA